MEKNEKKAKSKNNSSKIIKKDNSNKAKKIESTDNFNQKGKIKKPQKMEPLKTEESQTVKRFIVVLIIVIACVVGIYFFTRAFISKDLFNNNDTEETTEVSFNYDITILGSTFNRPYSEYYVIAYKSSDQQASTLSTVINNYISSENALKLYYADLDDYMNSSFYDPENVNSKATKASELRVGDYTLIKIKDGVIDSYIEGVDNITEELSAD